MGDRYAAAVPLWVRALAHLDENGPTGNTALARDTGQGCDHFASLLVVRGWVEQRGFEQNGRHGRNARVWAITPAGTERLRAAIVEMSDFTRGES